MRENCDLQNIALIILSFTKTNIYALLLYFAEKRIFSSQLSERLIDLKCFFFHRKKKKNPSMINSFLHIFMLFYPNGIVTACDNFYADVGTGAEIICARTRAEAFSMKRMVQRAE